MADSTNGFSDKALQQETDIAALKKDLHGWKEVLLPLNKVLHWEKSHYPAVIIGAISFFFLNIWYFEPSVLTTLSLLGLVICLLDFLIPTITANLFNKEWTRLQEKQFEEICLRILNFKQHSEDLRDQMVTMKTDKPKVYFAVVMGSLTLVAWIGNCIDNLLLTYLMVCFIVMLPGLRHKGILQKYLGSAIKTAQETIKGQSKAKRQ